MVLNQRTDGLQFYTHGTPKKTTTVGHQIEIFGGIAIATYYIVIGTAIVSYKKNYAQ